jgi:hypothetical protein
MTDTFFCKRGAGPDSPFKPPFNGEAHWRTEANGDRTCSYCGSLHPDDFLDIMQRYAAGEEGYRFELTTKSYKVYANRAGVRNANDGGIKFYGAHSVEEDDPRRADHEAAWTAAVTRSRKEFAERFGAA